MSRVMAKWSRILMDLPIFLSKFGMNRKKIKSETKPVGELHLSKEPMFKNSVLNMYTDYEGILLRCQF